MDESLYDEAVGPPDPHPALHTWITPEGAVVSGTPESHQLVRCHRWGDWIEGMTEKELARLHYERSRRDAIARDEQAARDRARYRSAYERFGEPGRPVQVDGPLGEVEGVRAILSIHKRAGAKQSATWSVVAGKHSRFLGTVIEEWGGQAWISTFTGVEQEHLDRVGRRYPDWGSAATMLAFISGVGTDHLMSMARQRGWQEGQAC